MKNSLLFHLWSGLSGEEKSALSQMVNSPFHNQQEAVIKLHSYMMLSDAAQKEPLKEEAFRYITGLPAFDDARMRHIMSWYSSLMEQFYLWKNLQDKLRGQAMLLEEFQRRKMRKPFEMLRNRLIRNMDASTLRDAEYHHVMKDVYGFTAEMEESRNPAVQSEMQRFTTEIDVYYLIEKLKSAVSILSHSKLYQIEYDLGLLSAVLEVAEEKGYLSLPEVEVYYYVYLTQAKPEQEDYFKRLQAAILKVKNVLPQTDQRTLLLLAINYGIGKMNQGKPSYAAEVFALYRNGLDTGILLEDGVLSAYAYKNICSAAFQLQEYSWASGFIHQYKDNLPETFRESYFTYNLARLHLKQKNFSNVISLLNTVYIRDVFTQLATRVLQIQAGYEQGDLEFVEYQLDNFRQVLHRKELLTSHKKNYGNFVKLARSLVRVNPHQVEEISALEKNITKTELLVEREWLLEKTGMLKAATN